MGTEPEIIRDYVETGRLKLVFSPILDHGASLRSTEAAYCAGAQGRFWEMHDALFAEQSRLYQSGLDETLQALASGLALDMAAFDECMTNGRYAPRIREQHSAARERGIRIRPTFRIGERRIEGALPYAQFQQILAEALP